jgi:hypothetical protein
MKSKGSINSRITADLGDPVLLKLLKSEANEKNSSIREVLIVALESYFGHRLESKALQKASDAVFEEWNDKKDSDYDNL